MPKGLSIHHVRPAGLRGLWTRLRNRRRRRHRLRDEVHRLHRTLDELRHDHRALAERNASVEALSAELMRFNLDLSQVSRLDPMTGLLNRAAFEACLAQEHALAKAALHAGADRPYSVIMLDVDHFKHFNDTLGHPAGDRCLVQIAGALQNAVRKTDFVGRYGGEEFIALCPGLGNPHAHELAERLCQAVRDLGIAHPQNSAGPVVTVSVGLATGGRADPPHPPGDPDVTPPDRGAAAVLAADRMLYRAKHAGRNRVAAA
ncbi:MAG: GGDEF domain-containing protein [Planctomycetota bacterium]